MERNLRVLIELYTKNAPATVQSKKKDESIGKKKPGYDGTLEAKNDASDMQSVKLIKEVKGPSSIGSQDTRPKSEESVEHFVKKNPKLFSQFQPSLQLQNPLPDNINAYFDGSARPNPGPAGIGYLGRDRNGSIIYFKQSLHIGNRTNNQAEFTSLLWAMADCAIKKIPRVNFFGDSLLVIEGVNNNWNIKNPDLLVYLMASQYLKRYFVEISFRHIPRDLNTEADRLSQEASTMLLDL